MRDLSDDTYCTLTRQSSRNWERHVKQHVFLYQFWTARALLNIFLGHSNHDSQNFLDETMSLDHELRMRCCAISLNYGLWWDNIAMSFGPSASASFCEYGLFWVLKEIFPKFIICWCGANCQWNKFEGKTTHSKFFG